jgi:hypothetical protein
MHHQFHETRTSLNFGYTSVRRKGKREKERESSTTTNPPSYPLKETTVNLFWQLGKVVFAIQKTMCAFHVLPCEFHKLIIFF